MQQEHKAGNFINKLQFILTTPQYSEIICWDQTKTIIDIIDQKKMEDQIIPLYFRHSKFQSFVRQLNIYGFKKIRYNGRQRFTHTKLISGNQLHTIISKKNFQALKTQTIKQQQQSHQIFQNNIENKQNKEQLEKIFFHITNSYDNISQNKIAEASFPLYEAPFNNNSFLMANHLQQSINYQHYLNYFSFIMLNNQLNYNPYNSNQHFNFVEQNKIQNK